MSFLNDVYISLLVLSHHIFIFLSLVFIYLSIYLSRDEYDRMGI